MLKSIAIIFLFLIIIDEFSSEKFSKYTNRLLIFKPTKMRFKDPLYDPAPLRNSQSVIERREKTYSRTQWPRINPTQ